MSTRTVRRILLFVAVLIFAVSYGATEAYWKEKDRFKAIVSQYDNQVQEVIRGKSSDQAFPKEIGDELSLLLYRLNAAANKIDNDVRYGQYLYGSFLGMVAFAIFELFAQIRNRLNRNQNNRIPKS